MNETLNMEDLMGAIKIKDIDKVRSILKNETFAAHAHEYSSKSSMTPLMYAAHKGNIDAVNSLLALENVRTRAHEASISWYGETSTALVNAAKRGHIDVVDSLLKLDNVREHAHEATDHVDSALIFAARMGHIDVVNSLLKVDKVKEHANDKSRGYGELTALELAILDSRIDIVNSLLKLKNVREDALESESIKADLTNEKQVELLTLADYSGHTETYDFLRTAVSDEAKVIFDSRKEKLWRIKQSARNEVSGKFPRPEDYWLPSQELREIVKNKPAILKQMDEAEAIEKKCIAKLEHLDSLEKLLKKYNPYVANFFSYIISIYIVKCDNDITTKDLEELYSKLNHLPRYDYHDVVCGVTALKDRNKVSKENILALISAAENKADDPRAILDKANELCCSTSRSTLK